MASDQDHQQLQSLRTGPSEPSITKEEEFNLLVVLLATSEKGELKIRRRMAELLVDDLQGCGKVDLVRLMVKINFTAEKQVARIGVFNADVARTIAEVSMMPGGIMMTTTAYNYGGQREFEVVIPDLYSKQIQPISSMAPTFALYLNVSQGVTVSIISMVKVHGPRSIVRTQVFKD